MQKRVIGKLDSGTSMTITFDGSTSALISLIGTAGAAHGAYFYQGYNSGSNRQHVATIQAGSALGYDISETAQEMVITNSGTATCTYSIDVLVGVAPKVS